MKFDQDNTQARTNVTYSELLEINSVPAPYVDRINISQKNEIVRITFAEDVGHGMSAESNARCAVSMSISGFFKMLELFNQHGANLQKAFEAQRTALGQKSDASAMKYVESENKA